MLPSRGTHYQRNYKNMLLRRGFPLLRPTIILTATIVIQDITVTGARPRRGRAGFGWTSHLERACCPLTIARLHKWLITEHDDMMSCQLVFSSLFAFTPS